MSTVATGPPPPPMLEPALPAGSRRPSGRALVRLLAMGAGAASVCAVVFRFAPARSSFYPRCILHEMTGLHCPACGATRATHELLHGHVANAMGYNALYVIALPAILYLCVLALLRAAGIDRRPRRPLPAWASWTLLTIILLFGVLRNLPFEPFHALAPHEPSRAQAASIVSDGAQGTGSREARRVWRSL